jgi:hypothetical protein
MLLHERVAVTSAPAVRLGIADLLAGRSSYLMSAGP